MNYVRTKMSLWTNKGTIEQGSAFAVKDVAGMWKVLLGPFDGVLLNKIHCEEMYLQREYLLLLQQIERTIEEQKAELPEIPLEVAEAIITCTTAGLSRIDIVTLMGNVRMLFRDYDKSIIDSLTVINEFASKTVGGGQDLLVALVNGYTVKQELTLDERLKEGVIEIIDENFSAETEVLADKVTKLVQSLYAEQSK